MKHGSKPGIHTSYGGGTGKVPKTPTSGAKSVDFAGLADSRSTTGDINKSAK